MLRKHTRPARRSATTIVETALVISGCLAFMFAIFEYGRVTMMHHLVHNAVREGARIAVACPTSTTPIAVATDEVQSAVIYRLAGQDLRSAAGTPLQKTDILIYKADANGNSTGGLWTDAPFGQNIAVEVTTYYLPMLPTLGILPGSQNIGGSYYLPIRAKCLMRSEAN
jgi:Flp pilus assembly protein TadG